MEPRLIPKLGDKVFRVSRVKPWEIPLRIIPLPKPGRGVSLFELVRGFAFIIIAGALLLILPIATKSGSFTHPIDALFTATSAVCVTGLATLDIANHFSFFGQLVILILMQLGGFGYMTSATILIMTLGRRIGLKERLLIGESLGVEPLRGLVNLVRMMAFYTVVIESIGAIILFIYFLPQNSVLLAIWKAIFHAISAFNNCGYDLMGDFRSIGGFQGNPAVILTHAALIILGGISFMVVRDVYKSKRFGKFKADTKLVLVTTILLLAAGTVIIFASEFNNPDTFGTMSVFDKIVNAFFHSVSPRTAGFASVDIGKMFTFTQLFIIFLMFVGGAAGSTAGGIKVNTFGLLSTTIWSVIRRKEHAGAFGREFRVYDVYRAIAVTMLVLTIIIIMTALLAITETFGFKNLLFEVVSAIGTVGLSTGITPDLSFAGKIIIMITMFVGRLGPLTFAVSMVTKEQSSAYRFPEESVRIG